MKKDSKPIKPKRLGQKLLQIRKSLDLSQNDLLKKIGYEGRLYRSNISQYERGDREPPLLVLLCYARLVETSTDVLIDDKLNLPDL